jgi:MFS family permease
LGLSVFLNSVGMVGEQVVLGWLVLELTNSPLMVGLALGLRMAPMLLVGIPAGVVADRGDRRRLVQATSVGQAGASAVLGLLALLGAVEVWHLLLLTFVSGSIRALHQTARQSYAHDLVGGAGLLDGLALMGLAMRIGGLLGSLVAGALIAHGGPGAAYLLVAAGYLASAGALEPAGAGRRERAPAVDSAWRSVVDFLGVVRHHRVLPLLIGLTAAGEALGFSHQALLPSLARDVLGVGPTGLGAMTAARSIGGILGIALVTQLGQVRGSGALFLAVLAAFGGSLVALGAAPGFLSVLLILVAANAMGASSDVISQSLIQLSVPSDLRGRAGGAWVVAIGIGPLGQLQIGALASLAGVGIALAVSGAALVTVVAAGALCFPRLRRL